MLNYCSHLLDINECTVGTHDCQQICANVAPGDGGYTCSCNTGYDLQDDNTCLTGIMSINHCNFKLV